MREEHLNFLPFVTTDLVGFRLSAGACEVPGVLVLFPADRSADRVGTALLFRWAPLTIGFECAVPRERRVVRHLVTQTKPTEPTVPALYKSVVLFAEIKSTMLRSTMLAQPPRTCTDGGYEQRKAASDCLREQAMLTKSQAAPSEAGQRYHGAGVAPQGSARRRLIFREKSAALK